MGELQIDRRKGAILGVSKGIPQISDASGQDGTVNIFLCLVESLNRVLMFSLPTRFQFKGDVKFPHQAKLLEPETPAIISC